MNIKNILVSIGMMLATTTVAQVSGTIADQSGEPLIGANLMWLGTSIGTAADVNGNFTLPARPGATQIVASYVGFAKDTIRIAQQPATVAIVLKAENTLNEVVVRTNRLGVGKLKGVVNGLEITQASLVRDACCNLGESFTTNASVDVNYSDAATGAKQIKLLGLAGTYVQMLTENIPNFRGAAAPYSLGYVPGTWMQSIQVSKGSASVKNGYESITGQINVEYKKPETEEEVNVNLFGNLKSRYEANLDGNIHLNERVSTSVLAHYENTGGNHDDNKDGFLDNPRVEQFNIFNRWRWKNGKHTFLGGVKLLGENRNSGQTDHAISHNGSSKLYKINIDTKRYELFAKNALTLNAERGTNIALILSGSLHEQDATFGNKVYDVQQRNGYASLLFESDLGKAHSLSAGLSINHDYFDQKYRLTHNENEALTSLIEQETVPGAYVQYTYHLNDKWTLMGGIRIDHSSLHGAFITPRTHLKYSPSETFTLRASAGKGYRSVFALAEYNYLLASGRKLIIKDIPQEAAWNYGISADWYVALLGNTLKVNAEYYYTDFRRQAVMDMDRDAKSIYISSLDGKSYSHTMQLEATYPITPDLSVTMAYRLNDVKSTYNGTLQERPLTSRYKGLVTASYKTPLGLWQFDATLQLNGSGRMPAPYITADGSPSWSSRFSAYEQLNVQITRWFRKWSVYVGAENLTGFNQKNAIIAADKPWSEQFDPTMVWAPTHGATVYAGLRWSFKR